MPEGWHYVQPMEGKDETIRGSSYDDLQNKVLEFRIANSMPIGDIKQDVDEYICTKYPAQCSRRAQNYVYKPKESRAITPLMARIREWINDLKKAPVTLVSKMEAQRRASKCIGCPQNIRWEDSCAPCVGDINKQTHLIRQAKTVSRENELRGCRILGHHNKTAIWMPKDRLRNAENLPSHCWRNDE